MRFRLLGALLASGVGAWPAVAHAQACSANVPHLTGEWLTLAYQMPINAPSVICRFRGSSGQARRLEVSERYDVARTVAEQLAEA